MYKLAFVIGTRPDVIRCSELIRLLDAEPLIDLTFIHSGQHYDEELWGDFLRELGIREPDVVLDVGGVSPCQQHSRLISQLESALLKIKPHACMFWGDTHTVIGSIVPLRLNIPIIHGEGGMRSYDWRMPEERNRVLIDNISDILYVYHDDYRVQLVQEGVSPDKICVVGNIIVDVINKYKGKFEWSTKLKHEIGGVELEYKKFALMTLHRDEHMEQFTAQAIVNDVGTSCSKRSLPVVLIEMPRLATLNLTYPSNFIVTKPLGFFEFSMLERGAAVEYTDSGTNQEVASLFGTPCVVTRSCTERPECRDCGTTVLSGDYQLSQTNGIEKATQRVLTSRHNKEFSLGDGFSSERIVRDVVGRLYDLEFDNSVGFKERHWELM